MSRPRPTPAPRERRPPETRDNGELPEGWANATITQVIEDCQPGFASGEKDVANGVRHLRMNNIGNAGELILDLVRTVPKTLAKPHHELQVDDVLVCTTNSAKLVGKCAIFDLEGRYAFSNHLTRLRPNRNAIDGSYLRWCLWSLWMAGTFDDKCKHWVNQSTIPKSALLESELLLPPLAEQRRIVGKLEVLLAKVSSSRQRLSRVPGLLKRFRQSVLAAACSGKLTTDWRGEKALDNDHASIPLDEVADYVGGFAYRSPTFLPTGRNQVVRIGNVRPMHIDVSAAPVFIPDELAAETERFRLQPNDIVISMTGTKYKRDYGNAAMVEHDHGTLFLNQRVSRVRCGPRIMPRFLLYWMHSDLFRDHFFAGETGNVNQGNVGADGIRKAPIELPPLAEQHEIVRRVERLFTFADQIEARLTQAQSQVDRITQSLLAKAFRGELVPTEAALARAEHRDYEPAADLLARIQAERAEAESPINRPRRRSRTRTT